MLKFLLILALIIGSVEPFKISVMGLIKFAHLEDLAHDGQNMFKFALETFERLKHNITNIDKCGVCRVSIRFAKDDVIQRGAGATGMVMCAIRSYCHQFAAALDILQMDITNAGKICDYGAKEGRALITLLQEEGKGALDKYVNEDTICYEMDICDKPLDPTYIKNVTFQNLVLQKAQEYEEKEKSLGWRSDQTALLSVMLLLFMLHFS
ncbi:unnamed protein product [Bursaphelenchus xylophilus]|uniref:(pine wood nematode) hypothetical protein n=1 Tax=Bursaphelenchus xylophilus TaxID=6326 RepID=A0A1I7RVU0_BURXY|nr:unnamed protein product [Bursaphelenchus xylophilus]CAG9082171.1 unnamed protein product [Bursaphelenchus xylophilus]